MQSSLVKLSKYLFEYLDCLKCFQSHLKLFAQKLIADSAVARERFVNKSCLWCVNKKPRKNSHKYD